MFSLLRESAKNQEPDFLFSPGQSAGRSLSISIFNPWFQLLKLLIYLKIYFSLQCKINNKNVYKKH